MEIEEEAYEWLAWIELGVHGVDTTETDTMSVACSTYPFPREHFWDFVRLYAMWVKMTEEERIEKSRDPEGYIMATMDLP